MSLLLRAWVWYWNLRYGINATITRKLRDQVEVTWTEPDDEGKLAECFIEGHALLVLRSLPSLTREIARNARIRNYIKRSGNSGSEKA